MSLNSVKQKQLQNQELFLASSSQEKPQEAEVIAVGPGTADVKMEVSVGQKVFIPNMPEQK